MLDAGTTAIVLDSTADLPDASDRHPNWRVVPLTVRFGDDVYRDGVDLGPEAFYELLASSPHHPLTSQPSPADFAAVFAELERYERVVCLLVSGKLSGTVASATMAAKLDRRVLVVDSEVVCGATVLLAEAVQRRLERGTGERELLALVERYRREAGRYFTVDTLEYLVRGGRIGKAAGLAGQLLSVKPILTIRDGVVEPVSRVRGRGNVLPELERLFRAQAGGTDGCLHVGIAHANAPAEAAALRGRVLSARPQASIDVFSSLGPVVGAHAGPGALGLFWFQDDVL